MTEREKLMRQLAANDFAIVELHLFLNTHPNDNAAAAKLDEYSIIASKLRREYESKFGPISAMGRDSNRWAWISNPWPWDISNEEDK